jgi:alanine racemase
MTTMSAGAGPHPVSAERWAWVEIDLDAVRHNVTVLRAAVAPAELWAVVKADAYGHGSVGVGRAALGAGAAGLCVALVQEAAHLREHGVDAPLLVLSEQPPAQLATAVELGVISTVYSTAQIEALEAAAGHGSHRVQLEVDTGMRRVGCEPDHAVALAERIVASPSLVLDGVYTHLAVADEPDHPANAAQLDLFDRVLADLDAAGIDPGTVHIGNSAGGLAHLRARRAVVRAGIAMYGISPGDGVDALVADLRPVLSLHACVSHVKRVRAGESISYGHRHTFATDTTVATVPLGYADGVPRRWSAVGGEVLIGGTAHPVVGVVTMDQLMVDVGNTPVAVGDPVVLIGRQGGATLSAETWARRLGTIGYEVVCALSPRLPRRAAGAAS